MSPDPFTIAVSDDQLRDRLARTRWPAALEGMDWADGTDLPFLKDLTGYWRDGFDWRAQEAVLNRLPQFTARVDGLEVHLIHQRGTGLDPLPLVVTHGWPGSNFDLRKLVPLLADPAAARGAWHGSGPR